MDASRTFAWHLDRHRLACVDSRSVISRGVPELGLATALPGECFARDLRIVGPARRRRDANLSRTASDTAEVTSPNQRSAKTTLARCVARNWCASRAGCL